MNTMVIKLFVSIMIYTLSVIEDVYRRALYPTRCEATFRAGSRPTLVLENTFVLPVH
jgi:hypothetical protein